MKLKFSNLFDRIQTLEAWDFLWQVSRYLFAFAFIFSIITGFVVYFAVSLSMGFAPFSSWGNLNSLHLRFVISLAGGLLIFSILLTLMLLEIYERIIYRPVKDLLQSIEKKTHSGNLSNNVTEYFRPEKQSIFALRSPAKSWSDSIIEAVDMYTEGVYIDELTGCRNRKYLSSIVSEILKTQTMCALSERNRPKTHATVCYAMYLIDIDYFKTINDEFGHQCGDEVLKKVGSTLKACVGDSGTVIRNGGEEFLLIVSHHFPVDYAHYAESIRKMFSESVKVPADLTHPERNVTCSVGFAPYPIFEGPDFSITIEDHVDLADQAMYLAKGGGRNTWRGVEPIRAPENERELEMALSSIEYGVRAGYFSIVQPTEKELFDGMCRPGNYFTRRNSPGHD